MQNYVIEGVLPRAGVLCITEGRLKDPTEAALKDPPMCYHALERNRSNASFFGFSVSLGDFVTQASKQGDENRMRPRGRKPFGKANSALNQLNSLCSSIRFIFERR